MVTPPFRIYYHDRPSYVGTPENAPVFGVLLILEVDPESGRRVISNGDYYGWDPADQRWYPYDYPGLLDYLQRPGWKRILIGRLVSDSDYQSVAQMAETDPDFPARSAYGRVDCKVR